MIECHHCKRDSEKRRVLERKPLILVDDRLVDGLVEFLCPNIILARRRWGKDWGDKINYKWFIEECGNHILARKK